MFEKITIFNIISYYIEYNVYWSSEKTEGKEKKSHNSYLDELCLVLLLGNIYFATRTIAILLGICLNWRKNKKFEERNK